MGNPPNIRNILVETSNSKKDEESAKLNRTLRQMHNEITHSRRGGGNKYRESTRLNVPPMQGIHDHNKRNLRDQNTFLNNRQPIVHVPNAIIMSPPFEDAKIMDQAILEPKDVSFPNVDVP